MSKFKKHFQKVKAQKPDESGKGLGIENNARSQHSGSVVRSNTRQQCDKLYPASKLTSMPIIPDIAALQRGIKGHGLIPEANLILFKKLVENSVSLVMNPLRNFTSTHGEKLSCMVALGMHNIFL